MQRTSINSHIHQIHPDRNNNKLTFIILAAGSNNTRGENIPKSLIRINSKLNVLDHQIQTIRKTHKDADIIVVCGFEFDAMKQHIFKHENVRIVYNHNFLETTSLESFRLGMNASIESNIFALHSDCLFGSRTISMLDYNTPYIITGDMKKQHSRVGVSQQNSLVVRLSYGLKREWSEMLYLPSSDFKKVRSSLDQYKAYHNLFEMINDLINVLQIPFETHGDNQTNIIRVKENENINLSLLK